ncbi:UNVERIFIED_CONTAM: hypothetical protein Sradi_4440000 [Sesamum radiatum]|uniref:Uncharacterized protein n=1 Tax=Sesamum radiatum TaxID=300843 RepID=A0AAW2NRB3_SESRA
MFHVSKSSWHGFSDYSTMGNRIWIGWNEDELNVEVLLVHLQFIHCKLHIRRSHVIMFVTIVYGANDIGTRRELWQELRGLASGVSNEPWLMLGDFNKVLDMSEVCGHSGDIQLAIEEFRNCLLDSGHHLTDAGLYIHVAQL